MRCVVKGLKWVEFTQCGALFCAITHLGSALAWTVSIVPYVKSAYTTCKTMLKVHTD